MIHVTLKLQNTPIGYGVCQQRESCELQGASFYKTLVTNLQHNCLLSYFFILLLAYEKIKGYNVKINTHFAKFL